MKKKCSPSGIDYYAICEQCQWFCAACCGNPLFKQEFNGSPITEPICFKHFAGDTLLPVRAMKLMQLAVDMQTQYNVLKSRILGKFTESDSMLEFFGKESRK